MKLTTRQIPGFLNNPSATVEAVLVYGPDKGLVAERSTAIAGKIVSDLQDPFSTSQWSAHDIKEDPARLSDSLTSMSLLGGGSKRVVTVYDATDGLTRYIEEIYTAITQPEAYLVISAGELAAKSSLRKLFEKDDRFAALPCYALEGHALEQRIREYFTGKNIPVEAEAIKMLANDCPDWGVKQQELERISLYQVDGEVLTVDILELLLAEGSSLTLSRLGRAVADRDIPQIDHALESSWAEGIVPVAVLRSVQHYFQRLSMADSYLAQGMPTEDMLKKLRPPVFFKEAPAFRRHLQLWKQRSFPHALQLLLLAEKTCKTSPAPSVAQTLCSRCLYAVARS